jgi:hypothetical protein
LKINLYKPFEAMPYELYSETLGDCPLVGYYSMAWLMVYPFVARPMPDCPAKLKLQEKKIPNKRRSRQNKSEMHTS